MKKRQRKYVDPLEYALSISAEDLVNYEPTFTWEMGPVTEKQKSYLERMGILTDTISCCGHASSIIEKLRARQDEHLATPKQIRLLEKYGFYHVGTWDFDSASKMITRISNNSWFLPRGLDAASYQP